MLDWHVAYWGTMPGCKKDEQNPRWIIYLFVEKVFGTPKVHKDFANNAKKLSNWRKGIWLPEDNEVVEKILDALFGQEKYLSDWCDDLKDALETDRKKRGKKSGGNEDNNILDQALEARDENFEQKPSNKILAPNARDDLLANILDIDLDFRSDNAFLPIPEYTPSHDFVGRESHLRFLDEWALDNSTTPFLVLNAIGGTGKSYLTWEWLRRGKRDTHSCWRGRFWYSFYERGATLSEFLRCLLAFMSGRSFNDFIEYPDRALSLIILEELRRSPWLIVMDGIERLLAGYNRIDAASRPDEFAQTATMNGSVDDRLTIRPKDTDILRAFATAQPSKILGTSRLVPACLTNASGQPIPGVSLCVLPGMEPDDAIAMFRVCGVTGTDDVIGLFLEENCGNHPLVIGALAGLVAKDLECQGNFDKWLLLNRRQLQSAFRRMDLTRRKNHILDAALTDLSPTSWRLLSILACVSSGVGVESLKAFNPHSTELDEEGGLSSTVVIDESDAAIKLSETIFDLRCRGLLQVSSDKTIFDLHPVIRGCILALINNADKSLANKKVIDHFSSASQEPFSTAATMEALRPRIEIFHALLRDGNADLAFRYFQRELVDALIFNLEEVHRCQGFALAFFIGQPLNCATILNNANSCSLMNIYGITYSQLGELDNALISFSGAISRAISCREISSLITFVSNFVNVLWRKSDFRLAFELINALLRVRDPWATDLDRFMLLLSSHNYSTKCGRLAEADGYWQELDSMGRDWPIWRYRQGSAETARARWHFHNGTLTEQHLALAEGIAHGHAASRFERRSLLILRALLELSKGNLQESRDYFGEAVRAAREVDLHDSLAEAKYLELGVMLGEEVYSQDLKSRIDALLRYPECSEIDLAELCHSVQDSARSQVLACAVIKRIECQGTEFFNHYDRKRAQALNYDCQPNDVLQSVTEIDANLPQWYDAFMQLLDDLNLFDGAGDVPESLIGSLGHLIHKLKAKDTTGRWAYYFVLVMPKNERAFLNAIEGDGNLDLEDYGKIVASCYGEEPTAEVRDYLKEKYGFDV